MPSGLDSDVLFTIRGRAFWADLAGGSRFFFMHPEQNLFGAKEP
jgi:hypothetical protein